MRILVLSDSHKHNFNLFSAITEEPTAEVVYFLGDGAREFEEAQFIYGKEQAFIGVRGNCDLSSFLPEKDIRTICNKKIMATHGYLQNVKFGLEDLILEAVSEKCDIVLFGHTHKPESIYKDGIYYFNPGSLRDGCYGVIDITENGIICINKKL
ncbi:MAG: YfcE family phosphodiesterase [Clostridia bacterium]|nr:YfcE family phosphodiesterase [Clostridia bacterium]